MKNGVVIIGAGHAGVQAAASLRELGYDQPVILLSDEPELPYHKPPLSKMFIKDAEGKAQPLRGEAFYAGSAIDFRPGVRIERIDVCRRSLEVAGGGVTNFDNLILATGSRPRTLALPGADLSGVLSLRSLADARLIRDLSAQSEDVVILGGGFIGLEIAATLRAGGRTVSVLEAADRLLGRAVGPMVAAHVRRRLEATGARILLGTTVASFEGKNGHVSAIITSSGERLPARMVVVGIGALPNVELAQAAGLTVGNGIHVDHQMRSSAQEILAIGDVASYHHWFTGSRVRLESVQNATDQARLAARTIMGQGDAFSAVPWFWSDIDDMKLQMVGLTAGGDSHVLLGSLPDNKFSIYHFAGQRLLGIESVNRPSDHILGRKMLAARFSPTPRMVIEGSNTSLNTAIADHLKQGRAGAVL
ncbi:NAD(P)/FAD-dependent oxidoreductase [Mesorhizobium sp. LMG 17147]|uniref:NAD(P)/FAD-dependent oxidoreductase n=1 Tax=Mesorhizobium sp. LMG 17147 TaxID=2963091 RepID=UPI0020C95509|nr:FAD/NAD(P)-binding oxidoreductase [Mesorhizobium sp. LMG 17147]MCP9233352.1 NAD(P)/FAD-dependent oxidoreductase [Mesorhizobium sp. LMG 17147]